VRVQRGQLAVLELAAPVVLDRHIRQRDDVRPGLSDLRRTVRRAQRDPDEPRNGYRAREWDTRAGTVELAVPKLWAGSLYLDWLLTHRRLSWWGALTAFFWAGLVRVAVLHHVTWSVNSICHMVGDRPWTHHDRSTNVWPLAIASMGESWHNLHHADPTCARHGVGRGQIDMTARLIWAFEKLGRAHEVRWPTTKRLARLRSSTPV
jgi:hypothetical protein